ncbi:hypothetical protein BN1708_014096 [Verticillium longisporum]|uniref:GH16 domain-containing protein n=2 Tax=Verticillium longisporum TaxID=100787 RepID=A0A0G4LSG9_VERLO|nr:hypothetical protein BN1708_014096 [Verticillium longisporum]
MSFLRSPSYSIIFIVCAAPFVLSNKDIPLRDSECNCFMTNGSSSDFFSDHIFFDFRSLKQYAKVPSIIGDEDDTAAADVTSDYFNSNQWTGTWGIQTWNNSDRIGADDNDASVLLINSPNNLYIEASDESHGDASPSDTFLTMRTARLERFQTAAEFESILDSYQHVSIRMHARTIGSPGACTAMFTYRDNDAELADVQEADMEVLTAGPRDRIQYTNQPSFTTQGDDVEGASTNASMPEGVTWSDWAVHRMDWTPGQSTWFVNGAEVAGIKLQAPKNPSRILFNAWSDGGSWTGKMAVNDTAYLQIQWIEFVFNVTDTKDANDKKRQLAPKPGGGPHSPPVRRDEDKRCKVVCSLDESDDVGEAVMLWNGTSDGHPLATPHGFSTAFWMPALVISAMALSSMSVP